MVKNLYERIVAVLMKKVVGFLTVAVLTLGLAASPVLNTSVMTDTAIRAYAGEVHKYDIDSITRFHYTILDDGTAEIVKFVGCVNEITIPSEFDGIKVTSLGKNAFIPSNTTSYDSDVAWRRDLFKKVVISEGITNIGDECFKDCQGLEEIVFPSTLNTIGSDAFSHTAWLKNRIKEDTNVTVNGITVQYDKDNERELFTYNEFSYCILDDNTIEIRHCFPNNEEIVIPAEIDGRKVSSLGDYAFCDDEMFNASYRSYYLKVKSVIIPEGVTHIGCGCFGHCNNLKNIQIPNSLTSIEWGAFGGSEEVPYTVWMYDRMKEDPLVIVNGILIDAFEAEGDVVIPEGVTEIGEGSFSFNDSVTSVSMPESITRIDKYAFKECNYLEYAHIPDSVEYIGEYAFYDCGKLKTINIPDKVTKIEDYTFYMTICVDDVFITDNITSIGDYAFYFCETGNMSVSEDDKVFRTMKLPKQLKKIGKAAFKKNIYISNVYLPQSIEEISSTAFLDCSEAYYGDPILTLWYYKDTYGETYAKSSGFRYKEIGGTHQHSYSETITKAATCISTGIRTFRCSCGESYTEIIPAKGHHYIDTIVPPTTTEQGYTLHKCTECGDSYKDQFTSPVSSVVEQNDFNKDGKLNNRDIKALQSIIIALSDYDERYDINHDSKINNRDLKALQKIIIEYQA